MQIKNWIAAIAASMLAGCGGGGSAPETPTSEVSMSVAAPGTAVPGGTAVLINLSVDNDGPAAATNVVVALRLGNGLFLGSVTCTASGGAICPVAEGSFAIPSLPPGGRVTFQLTTWLAVDASGPIRSSPTVTADNDRSTANNTIAFDIASYSADVAVVSSGPAQPVAAGAVGTYTVSVSNAGPDAARDVVVASTLYDGQVAGAMSCVASGGAACPAVLGPSMILPLLPANGSLVFTVPAAVPAGATGALRQVATLTSAGDPRLGNNLALVQGSVADAPGSITSVELRSDIGDPVGEGGQYAYSQADARIVLTSAGGRLTVQVTGDDHWVGEFQLPNGLSQFQPGSHADLVRYPLNTAPAGGLSWSGRGNGCNTLLGTLTIHSASYVSGELRAIDLEFTQRCDGAAAALRGRVRWSASNTTQPPGPMQPAPAGLWMPDIPPLPFSYIYLESDPGDYIGDGWAYAYTQANAVLSVTGSGGLVRVEVHGNESWTGEFEGMAGLSQLEPGFYALVQRHPFHNPVKGGLDWSGEGRGCNRLTGWFVVDSVTYRNGSIDAIVLRFEQRCEGAVASLRGSIHWAR